METERETVWRAQPGPQEALLSCPVRDIFYGGARGGGKTDGCLGEWMVHAAKYGRHANGVFFRRHLGDLRPVIRRSMELFSERAEYGIQQKRWRFQNGAELIFRHLDTIQDAELYKGEGFTRIYAEELGDWPAHEPKFRVMGALRSAHGVPTKTISTGNPGGPGQHWVKECYIDHAQNGYTLINEPFREIAAWKRIFIPARLDDNAILSINDPEYVNTLRSVGSEALVRAWLEGDWNAVEGAFFSEFNLSKHVVPHFEPPGHWLKFRALDWGSEAPFCVLWVAVSDGQGPFPRRPGTFPREALYIYQEWYERGARLSAEQFGKGILERTQYYQHYTEADPSIFREDGGPSIAERMATVGCTPVPGDNTRIAGWDQVRARLNGVDGFPMVYISERCPNLIREISTAQHDQKHIEDVDTHGDDHAIDTLRYGCMSRPWALKKPEEKPKGMTFEDAMRGAARPSVNV